MNLTAPHRQTLICSAAKLNHRIYNYGYANLLNYSVLKLIYNVLDADLTLTEQKRSLLETLACKIEVIDPDICIQRGDGGSNFPEGVIDQTVDTVSGNRAPIVADSSILLSGTDTTFYFYKC